MLKSEVDSDVGEPAVGASNWPTQTGFSPRVMWQVVVSCRPSVGEMPKEIAAPVPGWPGRSGEL